MMVYLKVIVDKSYIMTEKIKDKIKKKKFKKKKKLKIIILIKKKKLKKKILKK